MPRLPRINYGIRTEYERFLMYVRTSQFYFILIFYSVDDFLVQQYIFLFKCYWRISTDYCMCYMDEGCISGYVIWLRGFDANVMLRIDDDI